MRHQFSVKLNPHLEAEEAQGLVDMLYDLALAGGSVPEDTSTRVITFFTDDDARWARIRSAFYAIAHTNSIEVTESCQPTQLIALPLLRSVKSSEAPTPLAEPSPTNAPS